MSSQQSKPPYRPAYQPGLLDALRSDYCPHDPMNLDALACDECSGYTQSRFYRNMIATLGYDLRDRAA